MIAGIGTDLCRIDRMEKSLSSPAFCRNIFSAEEWAHLETLGEKRRLESAAAAFAAKEAFLKALGLGLGGLAFGDICVLHEESGRPYFAPRGKAKDLLCERGLTAHLSLTHENGLALAFVLLERAD